MCLFELKVHSLRYKYLLTNTTVLGCTLKNSLRYKYLLTNTIVLRCTLKNDRMISLRFQGKPFHITVIQVYAPTSKAEDAEVEWFYEPTRPFRTNTQKRCPFHYRGLECKSRNLKTPGITGKFGFGVQNEAGQWLIEFCQENTLVIANTLF